MNNTCTKRFLETQLKWEQFKSFSWYRGADIDCLDKDNYTPLLVAASEGHTDVVSKLLHEGADLQVKDIHNKTAIFLAAEKNRVNTLKVCSIHFIAALHV